MDSSRDIGLQVYRSTGISVYSSRYTGRQFQGYRSTGVPVDRDIGILLHVYRSTVPGISVYRCTGRQGYRYTAPGILVDSYRSTGGEKTGRHVERRKVIKFSAVTVLNDSCMELVQQSLLVEG